MHASSRLPLIYDFSKYMDYIFQSSPTGISRIDVEYATFLAGRPDILWAGLHRHAGIRTHFSVHWLRRALRHIHAAWDHGSGEALLDRIEAWLDAPDKAITRIAARHAPRRRILRKAVRFGATWPWHTVWRAFPPGSVYFNTAYAGLDSPHHLGWLARRPDIRAAFMIHDLMPIDHPEWFWPGVEETFPAKMRRLVERADLVIVPSAVVQARVKAFAAENNRPGLRVEAVSTPPAREFLAPGAPHPAHTTPYFVICGTIEPRKNHALLIDLWNRMGAQGGIVPRLLVIGGRGWRNAEILEGLASEPLRGHVLEVSGLATADMVHLIAGAAGVLMPSLDEGYGMPIVEALSLGTPVIASDIPVFREVARGAAELVALDAPDHWLEAIRRLAFDPATITAARNRAKTFAAPDWDTYCSVVMAHLDSIRATPRPTGSGSSGGDRHVG